MKSLNTRILWYWIFYCIVGCSLLPDIVLSARYLPTRRSMPTQLERNERLKELFQHILESERDAHLSAANKYADQLKLIQKKSTDMGFMPEQIKDYTDGFGVDYDDKVADHSTIYGDGRGMVHLQQQQHQPWHFVLLNYGRNAHRNHNLDQINNMNSKVISGNVAGSDDLISLHAPRSQQQQQQERRQQLLQHQQQQQLMGKLHRDKQPKAAATNTNDLDWITSTSEQANSATDYDALYDDVNEKQRSPTSSASLPSSMMNFDRYRRNGPQSKQQLN